MVKFVFGKVFLTIEGREAREVAGDPVMKLCRQAVAGVWCRVAIVEIELGGLELWRQLCQ